VVEEDPCNPNPCGPNSLPPVNRNYGGSQQCQCRCLPDMIGSPPNCRPECILNSDCAPDKACIGRKCQDPCPGLCGINAVCRVRNHVPICVCNPGYEGDPFSQCFLFTSKIIYKYINLHLLFFLLIALTFVIYSYNSCSRDKKSLSTFTMWNQCCLQ
jgi:hypothetical protein